ncbi:hypothetical protein EG328_011149 [Venturia inaequalis]|uniref:Uncharacterized protein n=1 Tax=Venturia inaequalis TaxID=5025 RepID=A0A8H3Z7I1_VENIN|nr:hypothetical protein EG328_011149 [Venturia inaequalis]KAE9991323.1 hypothetical protein EG327_011825 [Venturia inaequalis]
MARKGGGERDWESLKLVFGCGLAKEVAALASMRKENVRDEEWKKGHAMAPFTKPHGKEQGPGMGLGWHTNARQIG